MISERAHRARRLDAASLAGIPLAVGLVLAGQYVEGGSARTLLQLPAALIVFGGTLGAVLVSFASRDVWRAILALRGAFREPLEPAPAAVARLVRYAAKARRHGVLSIEADVDEEPDLFLRRALTLIIEGTGDAEMRRALEAEMETLDEREAMPARVFDAAGGYAPTVGILGAVLGLIHVMQNLADPSRLGPGIAVAFVATVYGVGSANLVLLPIAARLRQRARVAAERRELLRDGALAVHERLSPRLIARRVDWAEEARERPSRRAGGAVR